jgi:hypothetical protein
MKLENSTVDELVQMFTDAAVQQDAALLREDIRQVNRLFDRLEAIESELKAREGDQRTALVRLYNHPNPQVRLKATEATLAAAPDVAYPMLRAIAASREYPQAGEAGMSLWNIERGVYKPT